MRDMNIKEMIHPFTRNKILLDISKFREAFGLSFSSCKRRGNELLVFLERYKSNGVLLFYNFPEYNKSYQSQCLELLTENQLYDNLIYAFSYALFGTCDQIYSNESYVIAQTYDLSTIIKVNFEDHNIEAIKYSGNVYVRLTFIPDITRYSEYNNPDVFYTITNYLGNFMDETFIEKINFKTKEIEKIYFNDILNNLDDHYGYLEKYNLSSKLLKNPHNWFVRGNEHTLRIENLDNKYNIFLSVVNNKFRVMFVSDCLPDHIRKLKHCYTSYPLLDGRSLIVINYGLYNAVCVWYLENKDISSKEVITCYNKVDFLGMSSDYIICISDDAKIINLDNKDITQEHKKLLDEIGAGVYDYDLNKSEQLKDQFVLL